MVSDDARQRIVARLDAIAKEKGVEVLYAAESGSRAWDIASPDSDYDVRFLYRHPRDWYLSVREPRDVIEYPIDEHALDINGWDIRKALRLFLKSNPGLYEWLSSPIVYAEVGGLAGELRALVRKRYDRRALAWHYANLAKGNWKSHIEGKEPVNTKKYFYVIRPLACLLWIAGRDDWPPMRFGELIESAGLAAGVRRELDALVRDKRNAGELTDGPRQPALDAWIIDAIDRARDICDALPKGGPDLDTVDALFRRCLDAET